MNPETLQPILRGLFGDAASAPEAVVQTDRGAVWAFSLAGVVGLEPSGWEGWEKLREALAGHDLWPLLVAGWGDPDRVAGMYAHSSRPSPDDPRPFFSAEELLRQGLALDVDEWLGREDEKQARFRAERDAWLQSHGYANDEECDAAAAARERRNEAIITEKCAAGEADEHGCVSFFDEEGSYVTAMCGERGVDSAEEPEDLDFEIPPPRVPEVTWVMLVPALHGWEVPAVLRFGDWNGCPAPQVHVALAHCWHQKYGAQLYALSHDMLSFRVSRPPQNYEEALPLAREHHQYDDDDYQTTLEEHANWLVGRAGWGFWWD